MPSRRYVQALVIGSGLAGCSAALSLADQGIATALLTSSEELLGGNSPLAQGGIIYKGENDSPALLGKDILVCGAHFNYKRAVNHLGKLGPDLVEHFLAERAGVEFDRNEDGSWNLTREGGHSIKRIVHAGDHTGSSIMKALTKAVAAHPGITVLPDCAAVDLLTSHHHAKLLDYRYQLNNQCLGAYVFNGQTGEVETWLADFTVLATGGLGQIFLHSTNSPTSIGSAIAMASRSGAKTINLEFVQFHPTSLFHRSARRFLITEAMRGEGAKLLSADGKPFMHRYDSRGELAPRDIVTRAIMDELLLTGADCVYLDAANHVKNLKTRFPTITETCAKYGIDATSQPIPVVPAAHYSCGGVLADLRGRTTIERLYACGECACTGVHGANRMASTSLLECLVWGVEAARDIGDRMSSKTLLSAKLRESVPDWISPGDVKNEDPVLIKQDWATIKNTMWNYVGIHRTASRLKRAFEDLRDLNKHIHDFYKETPISRPIIDLFHGTQTAYLVTLSALLNKQSLGCHYRKD